MRYYSKRFIYLSLYLSYIILPPVIGFNINPALIVHFFNSLGIILARPHFRGAHLCHIKRQITFVSYRVPIYMYTPGWRAAMWLKCLAEGRTCQALMGIEPTILWSRVNGSIQSFFILSFYLSFYLSPSIYLSIHPFTHPSISQSINLSQATHLFSPLSTEESGVMSLLDHDEGDARLVVYPLSTIHPSIHCFIYLSISSINQSVNQSIFPKLPTCSLLSAQKSLVWCLFWTTMKVMPGS